MELKKMMLARFPVAFDFSGDFSLLSDILVRECQFLHFQMLCRKKVK